MDWIQHQLVQMPNPELVLHIGAGACSELSAYLSIKPRQIVLVEPNPEAQAHLRKMARGHEHITIVPAAVSNKTGQETLRLFNFPLLSSLRRPTGLLELLPGLRQVDEAVVDTVSIEDLCQQFVDDESNNNWLIIDAPGEEIAVIESLANLDQINSFDRIILRAGAGELYEGSHRAEDIAAYLQQIGYFTEGVPDNDDVDWPRMQYRLNPKALECRHLKRVNQKLQQQLTQAEEKHLTETESIKGELSTTHQKLESTLQRLHALENGEAEKSKELDAAKKERDAYQQKLEQANTEHSKEVASLEGELASAEKEQEAIQKKLSDLEKSEAGKSKELEDARKERDTLRQKLEQAENKHSEETAVLNRKLASAEEEHKATRQRLSDLENREAEKSKELEVATKERDSTREKLETAQKNLNNLEARQAEKSRELESLQGTNSRLKEELSKARDEAESQRADLGIALRLQALRESDLTELQERFGEIQQVKDQQQELLGKLHQRLSVAARYLRLESDESSPEQVREELVRALSGEQSERE